MCVCVCKEQCSNADPRFGACWVSKSKYERECDGSMRTVPVQCESGGQCSKFEEKMSMATDGRVRGMKGECSFRGLGWASTVVILSGAKGG